MDTQAHSVERDHSAPDGSTQEPGAEGPRSPRIYRPEFRARRWVPRVWSRVPGVLRPVVVLLLCLVLVALAGRFVVGPYVIPSSSMAPGLRPGDRVLVNKVAYRFGGRPHHGDVVVFDGTGYFGDGDYVKRVVGVGGDHVVCCDSQGRVEVNDAPVTEPYVHPGDAPSAVPFDIRVPEGRLFLLGDHRSVSRDSRDLLGAAGGGMVPVDAVRGRVEWVAWPPGRWSSVGSADRTPADGSPADGTHG